MVRNQNIEQLFFKAKEGDRRALGRLVTQLEEGGPVASEVSSLAFKSPGKSHLVGLTGSPGAGKSTLTSQLIGRYRDIDKSVAVLAIDPSSPFSGGAILGDRVRMGDHILDPMVYVRSLATRGELGGLSRAVPEVARLMDSMNFDTVIVETVGVGQVEVEIAGLADTTIVVVNPGWGDAIQANKAGLMEIADIFVVNKADRPGVKESIRDLNSMLDLSQTGDWRPPIIEAISIDGTGSKELLGEIENHVRYLSESGKAKIKKESRVRDEIQNKVANILNTNIKSVMSGQIASKMIEEVMIASKSPDQVAVEISKLIGLNNQNFGEKVKSSEVGIGEYP